MILHFEIKPYKRYISNQRALLRCDAGVGRDKSHLITTPKPRLEFWRYALERRGMKVSREISVRKWSK